MSSMSNFDMAIACYNAALTYRLFNMIELYK